MKYNHLCIVNRDAGQTTLKVYDYFNKWGLSVSLADYRTMTIQDGDIYQDDVLLTPNSTVVLWRVGENLYPEYAPMLDEVERKHFLLNSANTFHVCADKVKTNDVLVAAGFNVVSTLEVDSTFGVDEIKRQVSNMGFNREDFDDSKIVVKPVVGAGGRGVRLLDAVEPLDFNERLIAQPFINRRPEEHFRIQVTGGKIGGGVHRFPSTEDGWLNNLDFGGTSTLARLTPKLTEVALEVTKTVEAFYVGVDLFIGDSGEVYILELNASPGVDGLIANNVNAPLTLAESLLRFF